MEKREKKLVELYRKGNRERRRTQIGAQRTAHRSPFSHICLTNHKFHWAFFTSPSFSSISIYLLFYHHPLISSSHLTSSTLLYSSYSTFSPFSSLLILLCTSSSLHLLFSQLHLLFSSLHLLFTSSSLHSIFLHDFFFTLISAQVPYRKWMPRIYHHTSTWLQDWRPPPNSTVSSR